MSNSLTPTYGDIGGLRQEVERLREMVEVPLRHPEMFEQLGVQRPRAVLLTGPAGVGKSLMARTLAASAQAQFFATSGPEIISTYYKATDLLPGLFEQAVKHQPSVVFIDELERIASRHVFAATEIEKHIAADLLTLIDALEQHKRVVVIGSSTNSDEIDPSFRRYGRFEREISVRAPKYKDRLEILEIHVRRISLGDDVDLSRLAALTQGFVGADLSLLCQEAALAAVRQKLRPLGSWREPTIDMLADIKVTMAHFLQALPAVIPSMSEAALTETAEICWSDIGGLQDVRSQLMEAVIMPLRSPELFRRVQAHPVRGVLLYGPSGTGKTLPGPALAKETDITLIGVKAADILESCTEASGRTISRLFRRARQVAPSIIFFDDIDVIASTHHTAGAPGQGERVLAQLLSEIDSPEQLRGVVVLGATGRLETLDPALFRPGRFTLMLEVRLPHSCALKEIFQIHLRKRPVANDVELNILVKLAGGFSGADVDIACQMAATMAIKEHLLEKKSSQDELFIAQRHLAAAIAEICMQKLDEK